MTLCLWISKQPPLLYLKTWNFLITNDYRYEIDGDAPAWEEAERQVSSAAKDGKSNVVVSVKSAKQKRKAGQTTAAELYEQTFGDDSRKKAKKGKKGK